jgi:hypothetical protein
MKRAALSLLIALAVVRPVRAQTAFLPSLTAPEAGGVLQGTVGVTGTTAVDGFAAAELDFAYAGDPTGTWFLIVTLGVPVYQDALAAWDTTTITDGDYDLRLRVILSDGTFVDATVEGLRVRNYTAIETPTPPPALPQALPEPTSTLTRTPHPTPTALPRNPAEIAPVDMWGSLTAGGLAALTALAVMGLYLRLRRR